MVSANTFKQTLSLVEYFVGEGVLGTEGTLLIGVVSYLEHVRGQ